MFDSGIGGVNVLKEFIKKYPHNSYYYYGDTLHVPYGDKDLDSLLNLSTNIIRFFERLKVDLIIIACGTISSTCFLKLKKITSIRIIDIITPTLEYLQKENFNKLLLFGTSRTIDSHIFKKNISGIIEIKTPEFVEMIENNQIDSNVIKKYLNKYQNIDALVLGCTHYPLLIKEFKKYLNNKVIIIDMGKILVNSLTISNKGKYNLNLYFTKIDDNLINNINKIIDKNYKLKLIVE